MDQALGVIQTLLDLFGVHALGWVLALGEGACLFFLVRHQREEQGKWLELEQKRNDRVLDALNRNTAATTKQSAAFELITRDIQDKLRELILRMIAEDSRGEQS